MIAAHFEIKAGGLLRIEPRHHHQVILDARERLENSGHLGERTLGLGRPLVLEVHDPVRDLHERHADRPLRFGGKRRRHGVQYGQRKNRARPSQEGPAGNVFPSYYHR
jgi:hypothetical protein